MPAASGSAIRAWLAAESSPRCTSASARRVLAASVFSCSLRTHLLISRATVSEYHFSHRPRLNDTYGVFWSFNSDAHLDFGMSFQVASWRPHVPSVVAAGIDPRSVTLVAASHAARRARTAKFK